MNLESLKAGFMSYLAEKLEEEGKPVSPENLKASAASIFMNGDEFKEYLVQEYNADASIFSKSINEIMNMDFVNGELVESFDDGSSPKISNEDIAAFLEIMNDFNNTSFDINADESPLLGSQALESEAQNLFASDFEAAAQGETPAEQSFDSAPDVNGEAVPNEILPEVNSDIASEEVSGFESADVNSDGSAVDETNTAEGEIAGSEITEGEITDGEITEGEITEGEITEGEITEGEITEGEITEGEITDEEIIDDEFSDGEIEEDALAEKLEEFYSNPDVLNALDYDKDGVLSDEEKSRFEDYVKNNYDETGEISEEDLDKILKEIEDGEFNYDNAPVENGEISTDEELKADDEAEDNKEVEKADETANAAPSTSPAAAGGSSGGGGVGGGGGISSGGSSVTPAKIDDGMSLEELEAEKDTKESELSDAQSELSDVYSGNDSEVSEAQGDLDDKEQAYKEAAERDPALEEYKDDIAANLEEIDNAQKDIDTSKGLISECDANISDQKGVISGLESQLAGAKAAVASYSGDLSDEQKANLDAAQAEVTRLENEIKAANTKLNKYEKDKEDAEKKLSDAETRLSEAEDRKAELDKIVSETASEETKEALDAYNEAKDNLAEVKESRASEIQSTIDSVQDEISELDAQINELKQKETERKFSNSSIDMDIDLQENLTDAQKAELSQIKGIYKENEDLYKDIAEQVKADTGISVPPEAICAIHYRESSCNFGTYLHNGQKLGQVTTIEPKGICFNNFRDAAVDALERELDSTYNNYCTKYGTKNDCSTMSSVLLYTERFNGFGYRDNGRTSAYVYSGTTEYQGGMYVSDGNYSASAKDPRCGTAVIIKELMNA